MKEIESESRFVLRQILFLLLLPVTFLQILFRRKSASELFKPWQEFRDFIFQPKATITLVTINIAVYLLEVFYLSDEMLESLVFQPEYILSFNLKPMIASWFLHANLAHLLGNMLFLYIFGRIIEKHFGGIKFLGIYFGSAIISDIISALAGQGGIGASGAIAGLISAAILVEPFYFTYLVIGIPLPIILVGWLAIYADISGVLYPVEGDNIGHFAHLGGYLAVSFLVFAFNKDERDRMKKGLIINILLLMSFLVLIFFWEDLLNLF